MLISFLLENWMSFKDETNFSMVASLERQHGQRLPNKHRMRLLPVAAIYGGNASGKTNFFDALRFSIRQIVRGTGPDREISVKPFRLDSECIGKPSKFVFVLSLSKKIYEYGFSVTQKIVEEEWLTEIKPSSEKKLYRRVRGKFFGLSNESLKSIANGTRDNQLFLTNTVDQKNETFKHIYNWFRNDLVLISPGARFRGLGNFLQRENSLYQNMNKVISCLDTGIDSLNMDEIPFDSLRMPEKLQEAIKSDIKEGEVVHFPSFDKERYLISKKDNALIAYKLTSFHIDANQEQIAFDLKDESDGTLRVIDLLPAFLEMCQPGTSKVFIIDELNRSLHTLLVRQLLESYLASCSKNSQAQLVFTTHDLLLMDQKLFRRDEMWVTERDQQGASSMIPLSDYKELRYDKDIRRSYLLGVLGGIPRILLKGQFVEKSEEH